MSFTEAAARLAGMAAVLLGWRPREFWAATPAELRAVLAALAGEGGGEGGMDGAALRRLKEMFPDG